MRLILIKTGSPVPHLLQALVLMDESLSSHPHTARARLRSLGPLCGCGAWISGDLDSHPLLSCITFHCLDPRSAFPYIDLPLPFRKVPRELPQTAQGGPGLRRSLFSPHPRSTAWLRVAFQKRHPFPGISQRFPWLPCPPAARHLEARFLQSSLFSTPHLSDLRPNALQLHWPLSPFFIYLLTFRVFFSKTFLDYSLI